MSIIRLTDSAVATPAIMSGPVDREECVYMAKLAEQVRCELMDLYFVDMASNVDKD